MADPVGADLLAAVAAAVGDHLNEHSGGVAGWKDRESPGEALAREPGFEVIDRLIERAESAERERDAAQHVLAALAFQAGGELRVSAAALTAVPEGVTLTSSDDPVAGMYVIRATASREEGTDDG